MKSMNLATKKLLMKRGSKVYCMLELKFINIIFQDINHIYQYIKPIFMLIKV